MDTLFDVRAVVRGEFTAPRRCFAAGDPDDFARDVQAILRRRVGRGVRVDVSRVLPETEPADVADDLFAEVEELKRTASRMPAGFFADAGAADVVIETSTGPLAARRGGA